MSGESSAMTTRIKGGTPLSEVTPNLQPVPYTPSTKITLVDAALRRTFFALEYAGDLYHC